MISHKCELSGNRSTEIRSCDSRKTQARFCVQRAAADLLNGEPVRLTLQSKPPTLFIADIVVQVHLALRVTALASPAVFPEKRSVADIPPYHLNRSMPGLIHDRTLGSPSNRCTGSISRPEG